MEHQNQITLLMLTQKSQTYEICLKFTPMSAF